MAIKTLSASGVLYTDRRKFYLEPQQFAELHPSVAPFITILMAKGVQGADDPDFKMFEHRAPWRYQYMDANGADNWAVAGAPGDTVTRACDGNVGLTIDDSIVGWEFEVWSQDQLTYKGNVRVQSVSGANVSFVAIGDPTVSNFACTNGADNDRLFAVGDAHGEGTSAPDAASSELEIVYNSCQEMKTTVEITKVLQKAVLRGHSDELARLRMLKAQEHKIKAARAFYWGVRSTGIGGTANNAGGGTDSTFLPSITDANSNTVRKTMGIIAALKRYGQPSDSNDQQNFFQRQFANYTYNQFVDDAEKLFQYQPNEGFLVAFCGPQNLNFWSKIGAEGLLTDGGKRVNLNFSGTQSSRIGFNFREIETPSGVIRLVPEHLFRGTPYKNNMVVVNTDHVRMVQYESDEYNTNIKTDNDPRLIKDEYFSNKGLGIELMESHSYWEFT